MSVYNGLCLTKDFHLVYVTLQEIYRNQLEFKFLRHFRILFISVRTKTSKDINHLLTTQPPPPPPPPPSVSALSSFDI